MTDQVTQERTQTSSSSGFMMQSKEVDAAYMQQQIFLLEDTVMTMSMAVTTISQGIRRWEKVIFPMMMGFIILAGYGFFLIYHLTYDIGMMSNNMAQMTMTVDKNMNIIAQELRVIQKEMKTMTSEIVSIDDRLSHINDSMSHIGYSTERMGTDLWDLNRSISGPMSTINNVAPWRMLGGRKEPPPPQPYGGHYPVPNKPQQQHYMQQPAQVQQAPQPSVTAAEPAPVVR